MGQPFKKEPIWPPYCLMSPGKVFLGAPTASLHREHLEATRTPIGAWLTSVHTGGTTGSFSAQHLPLRAGWCSIVGLSWALEEVQRPP